MAPYPIQPQAAWDIQFARYVSAEFSGDEQRDMEENAVSGE